MTKDFNKLDSRLLEDYAELFQKEWRHNEPMFDALCDYLISPNEITHEHLLTVYLKAKSNIEPQF